jgi:hypothetical protein
MAQPEKLQGLIKLRPHQRAVFRRKERRFALSWKRQDGKSHFLGAQGLDWMLESVCLVTFISASIALGTEALLKEAQIWTTLIADMKKAAEAGGRRLESSIDGLGIDDVCEIFEKSKLETKLWHDRSTCSRSRVIAPNPDTAVGWTGHIIVDEFGRIPACKEVLEAIFPFMSSKPTYKLRLATTPPPDDQHYSFELLVPETDSFPVVGSGNWYRSKTGLLVHRHDVWDAHAAGFPLFDDETGTPCTPEEHRFRAFDKVAWDRNYALKFLRGGSAAISAASMVRARALGAQYGCTGHYTTEPVEVAS